MSTRRRGDGELEYSIPCNGGVDSVAGKFTSIQPPISLTTRTRHCHVCVLRLPLPYPWIFQRSSPFDCSKSRRYNRTIWDLAWAGASILASGSLPGHILSSRCHVMIYHSATSRPPSRIPHWSLCSIRQARVCTVYIYLYVLSPASAFGVHFISIV